VTAWLSPGEKNGRKRMAEIAAVTDIFPAPALLRTSLPRPALSARTRRSRRGNG